MPQAHASRKRPLNISTFINEAARGKNPDGIHRQSTPLPGRPQRALATTTGPGPGRRGGQNGCAPRRAFTRGA